MGVYSLIWLIVILGYTSNFETAFLFSLITFIAHFSTDWLTSRIGKPFWKNNDLHNGFVVVGFDQVLHYLQLYFTFKLLIL